MDKILEFLKSLVIPNKIAKYRYISVLLSIIIFLLSAYVLHTPIANNIKNDMPFEMRENYNFLVFQDLDENLNQSNADILDKLRVLECAVDANEMKCNNLASEQVFDEEIVIEVNNITKKLNIKVDLSSDVVNSDNLKFNLQDKPYIVNEESYLLLFTKNSLFYQAQQVDIGESEIKHDDTILNNYSNLYDYSIFLEPIKLNQDEPSMKLLGGYLLDNIIQAHVDASTSYSFINVLLIVFVLPIIFVLIFWLFFKKNGKLKTYKEYYNVAAISSLIPMLLTFTLLWFWFKAFNYYMYVFSIYYLFVLYKINNSPEELE